MSKENNEATVPGKTVDVTNIRMEKVWVQNLKSFVNGRFPADERWKKIFIEHLDAINDATIESFPSSLSGWQDIRKAPRDGTIIILSGGAYGGNPFSGKWDLGPFADTDRPWLNVITDSRLYEHVPKMWMEIPGENPTPVSRLAGQFLPTEDGEFNGNEQPGLNARTYPAEMTEEIRDILSLMMWSTGPMAHALRDGGEDIPRKAEAEQAHVMHWLISLALQYGDGWRAKASDRIREIQATVKAAASGGKEP